MHEELCLGRVSMADIFEAHMQRVSQQLDVLTYNGEEDQENVQKALEWFFKDITNEIGSIMPSAQIGIVLSYCHLSNAWPPNEHTFKAEHKESRRRVVHDSLNPNVHTTHTPAHTRTHTHTTNNTMCE